MDTRIIKPTLAAGAVLLIAAFAAAPAHAQSTPAHNAQPVQAHDSQPEFELLPVHDDAMVGKQVRFEGRLSAPDLRELAVEAALITPSLDAIPISFEGIGLSTGTGAITGQFIPREPGEYDLNVTVRGKIGDTGTDTIIRRNLNFTVGHGKGIALSGVDYAFNLGTLFPGIARVFTVRPALLEQRGRNIEVHLGSFEGPRGARIDLDSIKITPARIPSGELPVDIEIAISLPEFAEPGEYTSSLCIESEFDRLVVPVCLTVAMPQLTVSPATLDFGGIRRGSSGNASLAISLDGGRQPVEVSLQPWVSQSGVQGPGMFVEGLMHKFTLDGGDTETIAVSVDVQSSSPLGAYRSSLVIQTPLQRLEVPVTVRVVPIPLTLQQVLLYVLLAALAALLLVLAWDIRQAMRGRGLTPLQRLLLASALVHVVLLLLSAAVVIVQEQQAEEAHIAVQAIRLAGERGTMGGAGSEGESFLNQPVRVDAGEATVDVAQVERVSTEAARSQAEPAELPQEMQSTQPEQQREAENAEVVEAHRDVAARRDAPDVDVEVEVERVQAKQADDTGEPQQPTPVELSRAETARQTPSRRPEHAAMPEPSRPVSARDIAMNPAARTPAAELDEVPVDTPAYTAGPSIGVEDITTTAPKIAEKKVAEPIAGAQAMEVTVEQGRLMASAERDDTGRLAAPPSLQDVTPSSVQSHTGAVDGHPAAIQRASLSAVQEPAHRIVPSQTPADIDTPATQVGSLTEIEKPSREPTPAERAGRVNLSRPLPGFLPKRRTIALPAGIEGAHPVEFARASPEGGSRTVSPEIVATAPGAGLGRVGLGDQVSSGKLVIGHGVYFGDWDCEKSSMPNLAYQIERRVGLAIETDTKTVPLSSPDVYKSAFVFMTGHLDFTFRDGEITQLSNYLNAGGSLWLNDSTHEGDNTFDRAAQRELRRLMPEASLETIPMSDRLFTACYDLSRGYLGYEIPPGDKYRENRLRGIRIGERWAIVYTRNDYGDGLEIDPNTHPLMASLTDLSPQEMQEGSIRMGMNLAFYFLSAGDIGELNQQRLSEMSRAAAAVPEIQQRRREQLDGRVTVPISQTSANMGDWSVAGDWSRDPTGLTVHADGRISVELAAGADGKNVIGQQMEADLSNYRWMIMHISSESESGARLAVGLTTGADWTYHESAPEYIRPGSNPYVAFDLAAATFKTAASDWNYTEQAAGLNDVKAIHLLFYPIYGGTVTIEEIRLAK